MRSEQQLQDAIGDAVNEQTHSGLGGFARVPCGSSAESHACADIARKMGHEGDTDGRDCLVYVRNTQHGDGDDVA